MLAVVVGCLGVAFPAAGQSDDRSGTIRGTVLKVDISRLLPLWNEKRAVGTPWHASCTDVEYGVRQPSPEAASGNGFGVSLRPLKRGGPTAPPPIAYH
jgi:hypothetical protein